MASSLVIMNYSDWPKSHMGTVFFRVDPLPSGHGGGGGGGGGGLIQKFAPMRLKIEQKVAYG